MQPENADDAQDRMLKFFDYTHLPEHLQEVIGPYRHFAQHLVNTLKPGPERTVALRKLLESKDCAVRSAVYETDTLNTGP